MIHLLRRVCHVIAVGRSVALTAVILAAFGGQARSDETLGFDFQARNVSRFGGLGAVLWPTTMPNAAQDQAIAKLRIRHIRTILATGVGSGTFQGHLSVAAMQAMIAARAGAPGMQAAQAALRLLATQVTSRGLTVHSIRFAVPPSWELPTWTWKGTQYYAINPAYLQDYANLLTVELLNARAFGIPVTVAELINEPDGGWDTQFTPAQYSQLVRLARATFDQYGLSSVKIEGPGTSSVFAAPAFVSQLVSDGTMRLLGAISVHEYNLAALPAIAGLAGFGRNPNSFGRAFFVTEFGSNSPSWKASPYTGGPAGNSAAASAVWSTRYAVAEVAEALKCIGDGASAPIVWQLQDVSWDPTSWGLLDVTGNWKPTAFALQATFSHIQLGSSTVGGRSSNVGLAGTAFVTHRSMTIAVANLTPEALPVTATFNHFGRWRGLAVVATYPASATSVGVQYGAGTARFTIPGNTVLILRAL